MVQVGHVREKFMNQKRFGADRGHGALPSDLEPNGPIAHLFKTLDLRPVPVSEQKALIVRAQSGDGSAQLRLFGAVFRFGWKYCQREAAKRHNVQPSDLVTPMYEGVMRAIFKFDDKKHDVNFLTYAGWWIRQKISRAVQMDGIVTQPCHRYFGDTAEGARAVDTLVFLDAVVGDEGTQVHEVIAKKIGLITESDEDEIFDDARYAIRILYAAAMLPIREQFAVETDFDDDMTLADAGKFLGVTRERVRQLRETGLLTIRWRLANRHRLIKRWLPASLHICIERGCGQPNGASHGGNALRCGSCFLEFSQEAREGGLW